MNLITIRFLVAEEDQPGFIQECKKLKTFWKGHGFTTSLFRDLTDKEIIIQLFFTEKTIDDLTKLIQEEPEAQAAFNLIKETKSRVIIKISEQLI